jgi:hypothetical protein
MLIYILILSIATIFAYHDCINFNKEVLNKTSIKIFCIGLWIFLGTRDDVGSDWDSYLTHINTIKGLDFIDALLLGDPGYVFLEWIGINIYGGIYFVNLICSFILIFSIYKLAITLENPWGLILFLLPYCIFVVGMAYTRQATAIGFEILAILSLTRGKLLRFSIYIIIGSLFHKTALILILLVLPKNILIKISCLISIILTLIFISSEYLKFYSNLLNNYLFLDYISYGLLPRLSLFVVFFTIFIYLYKYSFIDGTIKYIIRNFYILIVPICIVSIIYSTTIVDRILLYALPINGLIFSELYRLSKNKLCFKIIFYQYIFNMTIFIIWLLYSPYAVKWNDYNTIIL